MFVNRKISITPTLSSPTVVVRFATAPNPDPTEDGFSLTDSGKMGTLNMNSIQGFRKIDTPYYDYQRFDNGRLRTPEECYVYRKY